jgi:proline iminopeptidase
LQVLSVRGVKLNKPASSVCGTKQQQQRAQQRRAQHRRQQQRTTTHQQRSGGIKRRNMSFATQMRRLDDPFFTVTPTRSEGMLERSGGHSIHWTEAGHPQGMPVVVVHGGPGSSTNASRRRFYDPAVWRIVMFDQRGCGRSTPAGSLVDNTLQHTIGDMEALRELLGIERWVVAGGSWGSTVAVAYAEAHPESCMGLSLTSMWLARELDIEWWFQGVRAMFPELWAAFAALVPEAERGDLRRAYCSRILGDDPVVAAVAAEQLCVYERGFMQFDVDPSDGKHPTVELQGTADGLGVAEPDAASVAYGRIFAHYAQNNFFVKDTELLDNAAATIAELPVEMVVGRYDCCCPPNNSFDLAQRLPLCNLVVVPGAGHKASEVAMSAPCSQAPDRLRLRIQSVQALAQEQVRWEQECEEDFASPTKVRAAKIVALQEKLAVLQTASQESRAASPEAPPASG